MSGDELRRVQVVGWAPPWVLVSKTSEETSATVEVLRGRVNELYRMLPATDEETVIVFTQRWPLRFENGRLRRTAVLGAEIVLVERADGSGWNPEVGSIAAVRGQPTAAVDHVASLRSPDDTAKLGIEAEVLVKAWAARRCCEIDGCHTVLPPRQRVCESHIVQWRQGLLNEIESLERKAAQSQKEDYAQFRKRLQNPSAQPPSDSTTYQSVPCISCGNETYRRTTQKWGYWSRRTIFVVICEGCGWRYSEEPGARSKGDPVVVSQTEIEEIVRSGWPIRAVGDHSLRTVDAPRHWPALRIGRRLQTKEDEAEHKHQRTLSELEEALHEARQLANQQQEVGDSSEDVERCTECGWPFGAKHRYSNGPSCQVLAAMTHLSNGEWIRRPDSGRGVRALNYRWPNQYYGPIAFGHSSQYGLGIRQGRALRPIVDGETAAVTLARIRLRAHVDGVDLGEALQLVL